MSFSSVIGQSRVKDILFRAMKENAVAHAYCFYGIKGIGKEALAFAFAKTMNCFSPIKDQTGNLNACNECKSCKDADAIQHPNITLITALPAGKSASKSDDSPLLQLTDDMLALYKEHMAFKAQNPYHTILLPNANQIRIASIRDLKKQLMMSAMQSGRRFFIVSDAERMTTEAANAFLKTLEEPHDNTTFVLITSQKDQLPSTILSRCQQVYCDIIAEEDLITSLQKKHDISFDDARLMQAFAQGSYGKALEFLDEDMRGLRLEIVDILRAALKRNHYKIDLIHLVDSMVGDKNRTKVELMLNLLLLWIRDCYYRSISPDTPNSSIVNLDQLETIDKFVSVFSQADYQSIMQAVEQAIEQVKRNVNMQLAVLTLLLACREGFLLNTQDYMMYSPVAK